MSEFDLVVTDETIRAATIIQKVTRGYLVRYISYKNESENKSALKIQRAFRAYRKRQIVLHCKQILALHKINKYVSHYVKMLRTRKQYQRLVQMDGILKYYPSSSRPYEKPKKLRKKDRRKKKQEDLRARREPMDLSKIQRPTVPRARIPKGMKRKILVQLPPPWKNKDARRLSETQKEDYMYSQKANVSWARKELLSTLLFRAGLKMDDRDQLIERNSKFQTRQIPKSFYITIPRTAKGIGAKIPLHLTQISNFSEYVIATGNTVVTLDTTMPSEDLVVSRTPITGPFYDVFVHPQSSVVLAINTKWELFGIENGVIKNMMKLPVKTTVPRFRKYIVCDSIGFVWICLFAQKGPIYCIDPLTFQVNFEISLDFSAIVYPQLRNTRMFLPLCANNELVAIAFAYNGSKDVNLFTPDLSTCKTLKHNNFKSLPVISQAGNFLTVHSGKDLYLYNYVDLKILTKPNYIYQSSADIELVTGTVDPDLLFVSRDDGTVKILLGKGMDVPLRIPNNKLEPFEKEFADKLLGPVNYTKSRGMLAEVGMLSLVSSPTQMCATVFSDKLVFLTTCSMTGHTNSFWIGISQVTVAAQDYDTYMETDQTKQKMHMEIVAEIDSVLQQKALLRNQFKKSLAGFNTFAERASIGQTMKLFNKKDNVFSLPDLILQTSLKEMFPFIPPTPQKCVSVYEAFILLKRADVLPQALSNFADFLERFAPNDQKRAVITGDKSTNFYLPVKTISPWNFSINIPLTTKEIENIMASQDALSSLFTDLTRFTLSDVDNRFTGEMTTRQTWLIKTEHEELTKRLDTMAHLEAIVKNEMMNRIYERINLEFEQILIVKQPSIQSFKITEQNPLDIPGPFTSKPNRNPLLYHSMHKSIYETFSKTTLYKYDRAMNMCFKLLNLPRTFLDNPIVSTHQKFITSLSRSCPKVTSGIYSCTLKDNNTYSMIISEDTRVLSLEHYLSVHSFMGGDSRLIAGAKQILSKLLVSLAAVHELNIIVRTVVPSNIMMNPSLGSVSFGSLYDAQLNEGSSRAIYLPLPAKFASPDNPFLPPEYYHKPPRLWTKAFDVWQFGILMLYMLTGEMPPAYGSELLKCSVISKHKVFIEDSNPLDDPPIYEKAPFFYNWLQNFHIVKEGEKCVGENGQCHIQSTSSEAINEATILNLDSYRLLPFKIAKAKTDEARILISIIASCLQIDPTKRPTVDKLLHTISLAPGNQSTSDVLDTYLRTPNPNIFISQFFSPVLNAISEKTFPFTIGIISALVFKDQTTDDDIQYSFPLDAHATEEVLKALFKYDFMDKFVQFVVKRALKRIQVSDVNPVVKYNDPVFESLFHFFDRFVNLADHGHGILANFIDEIAMSLFGLYTGNAFLRHSSEKICNNSSFIMCGSDSAAYFVFTHNKMGRTVRRLLDSLGRSLKRTWDHTDYYFSRFTEFAVKVNDIARAMCFNIEKQKLTAVRTMISMLGTGNDPNVVRLIIDFNLPQKVLSLLPIPVCTQDCFTFLNNALQACRVHSSDPTYILLRDSILSPSLLHYAACDIRNGSALSLSIASDVLNGDSMNGVLGLVFTDVIWSIAERSNENTFGRVLQNAFDYSSIFVIQLALSSPMLQSILHRNGITYMPRQSLKHLRCDNLDQCLTATRNLASALFIRQGRLPQEFGNTKPPITEGCEYLMLAIDFALQEADDVARNLDFDVSNETRFDLRGTTALKAKSRARNSEFSTTVDGIDRLCHSMLHLFRCLCFYWRDSDEDFSKPLFDFLKNFVSKEIPYCKSQPHPAYMIHHCAEEMILYALKMPPDSPAHVTCTFMDELLPQIFTRDFSFLMICVDKDVAEIQLPRRYETGRKIRMDLFSACIEGQALTLAELVRFVCGDMLHNDTKLFGRPVIREEAVRMILGAIRKRDSIKISIKKIADELVLANFIEREKALVESSGDSTVVNTSIELLRSIKLCSGFFDDKFMQAASRLLEDVCARYTRVYDDNEISLMQPPKLQNQSILIPKLPIHGENGPSTSRAETSMSLRVPSSRGEANTSRLMSARRAQTSLRKSLTARPK